MRINKEKKSVHDCSSVMQSIAFLRTGTWGTSLSLSSLITKTDIREHRLQMCLYLHPEKI